MQSTAGAVGPGVEAALQPGLLAQLAAARLGVVAQADAAGSALDVAARARSDDMWVEWYFK